MLNSTKFSDFILLGLTDDPSLKILLFVLFSLFYVVTLFANTGIILIISASSRLHIPMYFFLKNLSFLDLCYSSIITPKTLAGFLSGGKVITYIECALQMYLFGASVTTECFLLGIMAYDRYVAICNPLLYLMLMNSRVCRQLVGSAYIAGYLNAAIHTTCTFQLTFCKSNTINHFYCDVPPLLKLSCTNTMMNELCLTATLSLFYSTIVFMYLRPPSSYAMNQDRIASVFYTIIIPMLNPLIYSLRNKEVGRALMKICGNVVIIYRHHAGIII
ncbi:hypothetical protein XENTR_v10006766 [Xenopus tropicalis]|nr:hypothetical protein XENTR_v10006766 [Xenopus tropicalis]